MIHAQNIVHETLDGETIVIDLESGDYYSLTGSGAEIWALLNGASSSSTICAELARRHACPESEIREAVESFIAALEREGLIEDCDVPPSGPPADSVETDRPWEPPKLECFGDMRDFLLVDPIHEVDERGWPSREVSQAEA